MSKTSIKKLCHIFDIQFDIFTIDLSLKTYQYQRPTEESFKLYMRPYSAPEIRHEEWIEECLDRDWKYYPVYNAEKKQTPLLVCYTDLPTEVKIRETLLCQYVFALKTLNMV